MRITAPTTARRAGYFSHRRKLKSSAAVKAPCSRLGLEPVLNTLSVRWESRILSPFRSIIITQHCFPGEHPLTWKSRVKTLVVVRIGNQLRAGEGPYHCWPDSCAPVYRRDEDRLRHPGARVQIYAGRKDGLDAPFLAGINYKILPYSRSCAEWLMAGQTPDIFCGRTKFFCISAEL